MVKLSSKEIIISQKIKKLKEASGSHSPNIFTIASEIPDLQLKIDACFLSNPYATDLFMEYFKKELVDTWKLRDIIEFYPSQNHVIAEIIAKTINVSPDNIFVTNGAIEAIQAILHNFVNKKIIVNIPTFSSYYEFVKTDTRVVYYQLKKEDNFILNIDNYLNFVKKEKPDTIVLINPNNPDGGYVKYKDLRYLLQNLIDIKSIIIDESFIHFAFEDNDYTLISSTELFKEFPNVIVIKSMSKDFGIAGIRAGYAVMDKFKVNQLLKNGYLWNVNGLTEYFFRLYEREDFYNSYVEVRKRYIEEAQVFFDSLKTIPQIKVYPSMANFALIELLDGSASSDFVSKLLIKYGIYTRIGSDKIGLNGEFVRIAARKKEENDYIIKSIQDIFNDN